MNAISAHRIFMRAAFSAAHAFAWVAAFQFFVERSLSLTLALSSVAFTYALSHVIVVLLTPLAAAHLRHGVRRSMVAATLAAAAGFAAFSGGMNSDMAWGITAFALLLGVYRALYFVPYGLLPAKRATGSEILIALMPAAAGVLIASTHFPAYLYACAAVIICVSVFPLFRVTERHEGFAWSYRGTFHQLVARDNRQLLLLSLCEGVEGAALLLIWPLAVWMLLAQSFPLLGVVLSLTLLVSMMVRTGLRGAGFVATPLVSSTVILSSWVLRIFAANAGAVILIDTYAGAADESRRGMDTAVHEQVADNRSFVDEYTALKEMATSLGRIMLCVLIGVLAPLSSLSAIFAGTFVIAACAGAISLYATHRRPRASF